MNGHVLYQLQWCFWFYGYIIGNILPYSSSTRLPTRIFLPQKVKTQYGISDYMQTTFFYLGRFLKKLADDQSASITKGSIYHIKLVHTTFYMGVDWLVIGRLMEVSIMFLFFVKKSHTTFYFVRQTLQLHVLLNLLFHNNDKKRPETLKIWNRDDG